MNSKLVKSCGYIRISTEEQLEGNSLEFQEEEIRRYAEQNGYELIDIYKDVASGKNLNRIQFQKMLKDINNNKFEAILTWKVDRIGRDFIDIMQFISELNKDNKKLVVTSTGSDSTKEQDDLFFIFQGYFSALERKKILERTYMGMKKNAQKGHFNGGQVYGYNIVNKQLVKDEFESKIVKEIFELRAKGKGYKYIALQLNKMGIKTKRNKEFSINGIKAILNNVVYIGLIKWGEFNNWNENRRAGRTEPQIVKGVHETIIPQDLWIKVQEINDKYKKKKIVNRTIKGELLLSGILRCPICGYGTVMQKSKGHVYYLCGQYHNKGATVCSTNLIKREFIEKKVESVVFEVINNEEIIRDMINYQEKINNTNTDLAESQLRQVKEGIKNNEKKLMQLEEEYLNNMLDSNYSKERNNRMAEKISKRLFELENNKSILIEEIKSKKEMQINEEGIRESFKDFKEVYYNADRLLKKSLLRALIKRIEVSKDRKELKSIEFWFFPDYRLPLGELGRTVS